MIVHDFHIVSTIFPNETDPPLIIDADGVLPGPITGQCFQMIAGRAFQIVQAMRSIEHIKFALRDLRRLLPSGPLRHTTGIEKGGGPESFQLRIMGRWYSYIRNISNGIYGVEFVTAFTERQGLSASKASIQIRKRMVGH